jgi:hypothetical protein
MPVTDRSAIVRFAEPAPTTRSVSFSARFAAQQQIERFVGSRQQGLEEIRIPWNCPRELLDLKTGERPENNP